MCKESQVADFGERYEFQSRGKDKFGNWEDTYTATPQVGTPRKVTRRIPMRIRRRRAA